MKSASAALLFLVTLFARAQAELAPVTEPRLSFKAAVASVKEALPHAGRDSDPLPEAERVRLADLRLRVATEVPRGDLGDGEWIDLHLLLQALDRRLSERPPAEGGKGEPVGLAHYNWLLRHEHELDLTAQDLEILGEQVFARTLSELERQAASMDPTKTWAEHSRIARLDHPATPDGVLPMCRELCLSAWRFASDSDFITVPDVAIELGIKLGERRGDKPFAWYQPGKLEGDYYHGSYVVTPVPADLDEESQEMLLRDVNVHWMRVVSLHEGIPGHHLQFAVASLARSPVRSWGYTSVYVEGWGLYMEETMSRHGFYTDPLTRLEQLRMRLWRAARVLIDSRLQTGRMTRAEAESLLSDEVLLAPANAAREVGRYLQSPTQPMSYVVGMYQIEALRRAAQAKEGAAFSERSFHDRFLSFGAVPIRLVGAVLLGERASYDLAHP